MRASLGLVASAAVVAPPVTIVYDTKTDSFTHTDDFSFSHSPGGIPAGVVVILDAIFGSAPAVTITYGGVSMTQMTSSPCAWNLGSEIDHAAYIFHLGASIPTGTQTVAVTIASGVTALNGTCFTVTGPTGTAEADTTRVDSAIGANPTAALTIADPCFCAGICISGQDSAASVTPGAGMTQITEYNTNAVSTTSLVYRTTNPSTNTTLDWTATSEDYSVFALALKST